MNSDIPSEGRKVLGPDDRSGILELVASGKITIDEATRLLSGSKIGESPPKETQEEFVEPGVEKPFIPDSDDGGKPRWFHVHVSDINTGKKKVQVNIPLRLLKFGLAIGKRFSPEIGEMELDQLSSFMTDEKGLLVDVEDAEDGERVLIYVD